MVQINKSEMLKKVTLNVEKCRKCPLWENPKAVPGEGDPEADIVIIGEAPGYHESIEGRPFIGVSGKLLTELLKTINIERSQVFICNMLRHRPPENRGPMPEEVETCKEYLDDQLKIIKPRIIITLGRFAMAKFLPFGKISTDHGKGKLINYEGGRYIFVPMYHPAAALRAGAVDQQLRDDFKKMPEEIERLEKIMNGVSEIKPAPVEKKEEEQLTLV